MHTYIYTSGFKLTLILDDVLIEYQSNCACIPIHLIKSNSPIIFCGFVLIIKWKIEILLVTWQ
jgi:hypothetical protein